MGSVLEGLKALKEVADNANKSGEGGSIFLKLDDGQSVRVRFLQELDTEAKNYDKKRGVGRAFFEHTNPDSGNPRFICTQEDEGQCFGCELGASNPRWKKRARLYINALARGMGEGGRDKVVIINQGLSTRSIGSALIEMAQEEGTITDRDYKIKRTGLRLQTTYQLFPLAPENMTKPEKDSELFDVNKFVKALNYNEQKTAIQESKKGDSDTW